MAMTQTGNETTLRPTRWKWIIAALLSLMVPLLGVFLMGIFLMIAFGPTHRITLKPYGFEVLHWGKSSTYRWNEVSSFDVHSFRYMFVPILQRVTFTPVAKEGKLLTRASKLLAGGTERFPAIGMSARAVAHLMNKHRDDYLAQTGDELLPPQDAPSPASRRKAASRTTLTLPKPSPRPRPALAAKEKTNAPSKPKPGAAGPLNRSRKQDPLVQDSFGRRWRTRS